ncbi:AAA family ATPase [Frondihabitans peucedani]|uniref:Nuclease SbcCD subunit C n=1 Tax=Frondihabitans peucedani TaxID=598626 RepID=A0ABP8E4Q9_9MICO
MDLHRLTLRAIGPYASEYSVDFAALGASGVFLLEGPTGSGKSTIIDAIVFALYGGLAGSSSSDDRLHSHHAAPSVEPFVELVFETPAGIHRIRRTPAWERPKARGTGTTRVNQSVSLVRLATPEASDGEPVSTRAQEVGLEIRRIIGLSKEQFLQTIVLPQGEFAKFLGATGEERRLVLQSLFGTEIYDRTTEELVVRRRAARESVAVAERAVAEALAALRGAAGDDDVDADGARAATEAFERDAAASVARRDAARAARDAAEAHRAAQSRLAASLTRRAELLERQRALSDAAAGIDDSRLRLDRGRRAAGVLAPAAAVEAASAAHERQRAALERVADEHPDIASVPLADLIELRDTAVAAAERFGALAAVEAGLPARRDELARARERLAASRRDADEAEEALGGRRAARVELAEEAAAAATAAGLVEASRSAVHEATVVAEAVRRVERLRTAADEAALRAGEAAGRARDAVEAEAALRQRRITGMAGELALALVDGEPCAVCGATSHPAPARLVDDHPSLDDVAAAESRRGAAEAALAEARDEASGHATRLEEAASALPPGETAETAAARLESARGEVARAEAAEREHARLQGLVAAHDAETARLSEQTQEARVGLATEAARLEGVAAAVEEAASTVALVLEREPDGTTVESLVERAGLERDAAARVVDARRALERAADDERVRRAELSEALESAGFDGAAEAAAAVVPPGDLQALEEAVNRHDRETAVVAEGLAAPEVAELTGDEDVDLDGATARAEAAAEAASSAADQAAVAVDRAERSLRALAAFDAALDAERAVGAETLAVVRMADVASASGPENRSGVTLGTYVLLRRFDDVVAAANARLGTMSSGRYQLEASERETSSRARKTGLALAIRDNATDTTRDPKSFSGGETFYASLSLALGLADVVQAEAGGIALGTLFVDEGFGTLDPETLDAVMSELGRLSAGGRVVGIVSHVEDLKQRIADRIEVRRRADGSSVLTSTAGV